MPSVQIVTSELFIDYQPGSFSTIHHYELSMKMKPSDRLRSPRRSEFLVLRFPHRAQGPGRQLGEGRVELRLRHRLRGQLAGALAEQLQQPIRGHLAGQEKIGENIGNSWKLGS